MNVDGKITILCYGDSNTFGYRPPKGDRYPKAQRWTTILAEKLGDDYEVIPEGVTGRTTAYDRTGRDWLNGLDSIAPTVAAHLTLDYIVIMLGTNDCIMELDLGAEDIAEGMRKLILKAREVTEMYQEEQPKFVIVAPPAIGPDIKGTTFEFALNEKSVTNSRAIVPLYRSLAEGMNGIFVDAAECVETSHYDTEHLTVKGHAQLAELMYQAIRGDREEK